MSPPLATGVPATASAGAGGAAGADDRGRGQQAIAPGPASAPRHAGIRFISLEGGEGSGKSTQARRLADWLRGAGHDVCLTREPGGSAGGDILREVLLGGHAAAMGPLAEACLLTSARRDHVDTVIEPALRKGRTVVCDRFADSTRIYQGYVGGLSMEIIDMLEAVATNGRLPDLTLVFDVSAPVAEARRQARLATKKDADDRFEREDADFHARVAEGFRWLCATYPDRCVRIDADGSVEVVFEDVQRARAAHGLTLGHTA